MIFVHSLIEVLVKLNSSKLTLCKFVPKDFSDYSDYSSYQLNASSDTSVSFGSEDTSKRPVKQREKSSKSASKSYLRNEVIIRNSDSGKGKFEEK